MSAITYFTILSIDKLISDEWRNWMQSIYIPKMMASNLVIEATILPFKAIDKENPKFIFFYSFKNKEDYEIYSKTYRIELKKEYDSQYGEQTSIFRDFGLLETLH